MKNGLRLAFRKGDLLAIALVIVLAIGVAVCFVPQKTAAQNPVVQIFQDGRLVQELPLNADASVEICGDYLNTVSVKGGRAGFSGSNCPGQDCVHSGWISDAGRSVVCLPNRVEIRITGASDVDFVVR